MYFEMASQYASSIEPAMVGWGGVGLVVWGRKVCEVGSRVDVVGE